MCACLCSSHTHCHLLKHLFLARLLDVCGRPFDIQPQRSAHHSRNMASYLEQQQLQWQEENESALRPEAEQEHADRSRPEKAVTQKRECKRKIESGEHSGTFKESEKGTGKRLSLNGTFTVKLSFSTHRSTGNTCCPLSKARTEWRSLQLLSDYAHRLLRRHTFRTLFSSQ